ncbi:MAG: prepilin-type N-terminal cleavage/methylation domain-containing protein [Ideonella sp.]|nr:prepilin-type N-terminal cleavage/methylation domain-containing protein [Ideonella sp.]MCC7457430.1 type IV pilin protein [Nitrospira sp.]
MRHSPSLPSPGRHTDGGFTLIELLVALAVLAVLAMVAIPSYQDSVRKGRRGDAIAGLNRLQLAQERFRGNNPAYASAIASMVGATADSPEGHYSLGIDSSGATQYQMTATAKSGSPQFGDTRCRSFTVTMSAGTIGHNSADSGGTADPSNANRCWPQ